MFTETTALWFAVALDNFRRKRPEKVGFITWRTPEQMMSEGMRLWLNGPGTVGYGLHPASGDIRNVFSLAQPGTGAYALAHALTQGGRILDCFNTKLVQLYLDMGFVEYAREPWNDALRPAVWDEQKYGRPDVVYMKYALDYVAPIDELWYRYCMRKAQRRHAPRQRYAGERQ